MLPTTATSSTSGGSVPSFLVTCIGAYADSGIGTGGFVAVHEGRATVIDSIDSTGLCAAGGTVYRFVRGFQSIVGYTAGGVSYQLKVPGSNDIHDIALAEGRFTCISTGTNEVLWVDALGAVVERWKGEGEGDAWHLNCLWEVDGNLYVSAFGKFPGHRGWVGQCRGLGFIMNLRTGERVVEGLSGPHNPRYIDGEWVVCDSHANALVFQRPGQEQQRLELGGFTRGFAYDGEHFYIGESANRKAEVPAESSAIAVVCRKTRKVLRRIEIPFPEIYELLIVPGSLAASMSGNPEVFQINRGTERQAQLEEQIRIGWREIDSLKRRLEPLSRIEYLRGKAVEWKRKLVG